MSRAKKALIVGGGVAGPVAAMALQRAGMESGALGSLSEWRSILAGRDEGGGGKSMT